MHAVITLYACYHAQRVERKESFKLLFGAFLQWARAEDPTGYSAGSLYCEYVLAVNVNRYYICI